MDTWGTMSPFVVLMVKCCRQGTALGAISSFISCNIDSSYHVTMANSVCSNKVIGKSVVILMDVGPFKIFNPAVCTIQFSVFMLSVGLPKGYLTRDINLLHKFQRFAFRVHDLAWRKLGRLKKKELVAVCSCCFKSRPHSFTSWLMCFFQNKPVSFPC